MLKSGVAVLSGLAAIGTITAIAVAQQPVPTVAVTAGPSAVAVQAAGPLAAGPTHLQISRQAARNGLQVYVAVLNGGVSVQDVQAALRRDDRTQGSSSLGLVSIKAGASFEGSQTRRDVTLTLQPGLTYLVVSEPETNNDRPPATRGFTTFTTSGASNGATAPAPGATVRMVDLRFRGSQTLPRNGVVRVTNEGAGPHIAIAFPLRRQATTANLGRALRANSDRAFGRLVAGAPTIVQNILSGGGATNDQTVRFSRTGRYALVCFFNEHHRLGMFRVVNVR
jgi:hypothetical protein